MCKLDLRENYRFFLPSKPSSIPMVAGTRSRYVTREKAAVPTTTRSAPNLLRSSSSIDTPGCDYPVSLGGSAQGWSSGG